MEPKKESLIAFSNRVFGLHVPEALAAKRDAFCPSKNHYHCSWSCPIYQAFYACGLSCNQALDRHPEECIHLMESKTLEKGA